MQHFDFFISKNFEKQILLDMFKNDKTKTIKNRARQYKFPVKLAKDIARISGNECEEKLEHFLNVSYERDAKRMTNCLNIFKSYWDKNSNYYFCKLENFFERNIEQYEVLLSRYVAGTSDWYGNHICTNIFSLKWKKYCNHNYCLLYEVVLSEVFKTIRKLRTVDELSDNDVWILSELSSFVILHRLFDEFKFIKKTYYEQVDVLLDKAYLIFDNSNGINDFIKRIIGINFIN